MAPKRQASNVVQQTQQSARNVNTYQNQLAQRQAEQLRIDQQRQQMQKDRFAELKRRELQQQRMAATAAFSAQQAADDARRRQAEGQARQQAASQRRVSKEITIEKGMSPEDVAQRTGMSPQEVAAQTSGRLVAGQVLSYNAPGNTVYTPVNERSLASGQTGGKRPPYQGKGPIDSFLEFAKAFATRPVSEVLGGIYGEDRVRQSMGLAPSSQDIERSISVAESFSDDPSAWAKWKEQEYSNTDYVPPMSQGQRDLNNDIYTAKYEYDSAKYVQETGDLNGRVDIFSRFFIESLTEEQKRKLREEQGYAVDENGRYIAMDLPELNYGMGGYGDFGYGGGGGGGGYEPKYTGGTRGRRRGGGKSQGQEGRMTAGYVPASHWRIG